MDEKSTNQHGQSSQNGQMNSQNQNNKPTLSWSQPAQTNPSTAPAQGTMQQANTNTKTTSPNAASTPMKQDNMQSSTNSWRTVSIVVGVVVVCVLAVWGMIALRHRSQEVSDISVASNEDTSNNAAAAQVNPDQGTPVTSAPSETTLSETAPAQAPAPSMSALVTVQSPQPAGMSVAVSGVSVTAPTWVVVYQNNGDKVGNALGAGLFLPGNTSGSVPLLRATEAGKSYFVGESTDNGDMTFDLHGDAQVKNDRGTVLWATFQAN